MERKQVKIKKGGSVTLPEPKPEKEVKKDATDKKA